MSGSTIGTAAYKNTTIELRKYRSCILQIQISKHYIYINYILNYVSICYILNGYCKQDTEQVQLKMWKIFLKKCEITKNKNTLHCGKIWKHRNYIWQEGNQ